jgi:ATP-dependent DNA helicase RecG
MESIILQLCKDRWLSRRQLSDLLQRNPEGLRARFLISMVAHGLLRLRYPDRPNRADQAYQTANPNGNGESDKA